MSTTLRALIVERRGSEITVRLTIDDAIASSLPARLKCARRIFDRAFARLGVGRPFASGLRSDIRPGELRPEFLVALDEKLWRSLHQPLSGRQVERLLGISARERRAWTKQGRLPRCGQRLSARAFARFAVAVYPVTDIVVLARDDAAIQQLRAGTLQKA